MKKLLSLLSILTISGTAVPTTIAASPYQKEEINNDINLQINNLENLKRNKRNTPYSKFINGIQQIAQQKEYWCGPAVGEMILRYFGITSLSPLQSNQYQQSVSFQDNLANRMITDFLEEQHHITELVLWII